LYLAQCLADDNTALFYAPTDWTIKFVGGSPYISILLTSPSFSPKRELNM